MLVRGDAVFLLLNGIKTVLDLRIYKRLPNFFKKGVEFSKDPFSSSISSLFRRTISFVGSSAFEENFERFLYFYRNRIPITFVVFQDKEMFDLRSICSYNIPIFYPSSVFEEFSMILISQKVSETIKLPSLVVVEKEVRFSYERIDEVNLERFFGEYEKPYSLEGTFGCYEDPSLNDEKISEGIKRAISLYESFVGRYGEIFLESNIGKKREIFLMIGSVPVRENYIRLKVLNPLPKRTIKRLIGKKKVKILANSPWVVDCLSKTIPLS